MSAGALGHRVRFMRVRRSWRYGPFGSLIMLQGIILFGAGRGFPGCLFLVVSCQRTPDRLAAFGSHGVSFRGRYREKTQDRGGRRGHVFSTCSGVDPSGRGTDCNAFARFRFRTHTMAPPSSAHADADWSAPMNPEVRHIICVWRLGVPCDGKMRVPAWPSRMARASVNWPIPASPWLAFTNATAASTLGPIDPARWQIQLL
jgi:hypothetical protein